jgi:hypothetical protein
MNKHQLKQLSDLSFILGFASILGAIGMWFLGKRDKSPEGDAHAERFGIFVGLWAPTFLIISERLAKYSDESPTETSLS